MNTRNKVLEIAEAYLLEAFSDYDIIEENVIELEEEWALSRYPNWEAEPIWIPSRGIPNRTQKREGTT